MIENSFHAELRQQVIVPGRSQSLREGVGIPFAPHPKDDFTSLGMGVEHGLDRGKIILKVGVDTDDNIAGDRQQASKQGDLMPAIAGEPDSLDRGVGLGEGLELSPTSCRCCRHR